MKNILIVTYVFPPFVAVGGFRIIKFCKYLPSFGFQPTILTPAQPNIANLDKKLLNRIDSNIKVYRTFEIDPFRQKSESKSKLRSTGKIDESVTKDKKKSQSLLNRIKPIVRYNLSVPDRHYLWSYSGIISGLKAIRKEKIDLILTSAPPQSTHLLGSNLSSLTGKPLILDFRDLWTQNTSYNERNFPKYTERRDRRLEKSVLRKAKGVVVTTNTSKKLLIEKNDFLKEQSVKTIYNGVDPSDFIEASKKRFYNDKFTILFSGSLYGEHRNPSFFLSAINKLISQNPDVKNILSIKFIGSLTFEHTSLVKLYNLNKIVEIINWMPQDKLFESLLSANLLLLIQGFDPVLCSAIPRKLFEYLITNNEIIAFAPPGEIPNLIMRYNAGKCFYTDSLQPIINYLNEKISEWRKNPPSGDKTLRSMLELETKYQVEKLSELCHSVIKNY